MRLRRLQSHQRHFQPRTAIRYIQVLDLGFVLLQPLQQAKQVAARVLAKLDGAVEILMLLKDLFEGVTYCAQSEQPRLVPVGGKSPIWQPS